MRLRECLVRAARGVEEARELRLIERAIQPDAPLARRDGQQVARVAQLFQHLAHAAEELGSLILDQIVKPVALGEPRIIGGIDARRGHGQRVAQAEPDHVAGGLVGRRGHAEIAARGLDALRDVRGRIHQRAVPVEDDQIKLLSGHAGHAVSRKSES